MRTRPSHSTSNRHSHAAAFQHLLDLIEMLKCSKGRPRASQDAPLEALQDCVLFLQAQKLGFAILTANLAEFDLLLQLVPKGRILFYNAAV
jgi:hypothetical protein